MKFPYGTNDGAKSFVPLSGLRLKFPQARRTNVFGIPVFTSLSSDANTRRVSTSGVQSFATQWMRNRSVFASRERFAEAPEAIASPDLIERGIAGLAGVLVLPSTQPEGDSGRGRWMSRAIGAATQNTTR